MRFCDVWVTLNGWITPDGWITLSSGYIGTNTTTSIDYKKCGKEAKVRVSSLGRVPPESGSGSDRCSDHIGRLDKIVEIYDSLGLMSDLL